MVADSASFPRPRPLNSVPGAGPGPGLFPASRAFTGVRKGKPAAEVLLPSPPEQPHVCAVALGQRGPTTAGARGSRVAVQGSAGLGLVPSPPAWRSLSRPMKTSAFPAGYGRSLSVDGHEVAPTPPWVQDQKKKKILEIFE